LKILYFHFQKRSSSRNCCCAYGCSNTPAKNPKLSLHTFPNEHKQPERRLKWIAAVKRKNFTPSKYSVICSEHFTRDAYKRPPGIPNMPAILKPDSVPTIFPAYPAHLKPKPAKLRRILVKRVHSPGEPMQSNSNSSESPAAEQQAISTSTPEPNETTQTANNVGRPKQSLP
jgi:hypothetical protein